MKKKILYVLLGAMMVSIIANVKVDAREINKVYKTKIVKCYTSDPGDHPTDI